MVVILRMVERITAVLIGGLGIYFGYRLFFHLPFEHDHEGQLELPGVKIVEWFMAVSVRDPLVPGSPRQTHPLTSSRLQAIAQDLRTRPDDFIEPANRGKITAENIRSVAKDIDGIGKFLADPDLRSFLRERGRIVTPALLRGACQAKQHDQEWMRRFRDLIE